MFLGRGHGPSAFSGHQLGYPPHFAKLASLLLALAIGLTPRAPVLAASCCGGGLALPSLVSGDDRASLTTDFSYGWIASDVGANGVWRDRDERESSATTRFSFAQTFFDRSQAGISLPFISRSRADSADAGLGDLGLTAGYEIITDWDYSPYRPKVLGFLSVNAPTGRSAAEATNPYGLDTRGRGFWAVGCGGIATKSVGQFDFLVSSEMHRSFSKHSAQGEEIPGFGATVTGGAGYTVGENLGRARIGLSTTTTFEDPIEIHGTMSSAGSHSRFTALAISLARDYPADGGFLNVAISYSDQTLLGAPVNSSLSRTVVLSVTKRYAR